MKRLALALLLLIGCGDDLPPATCQDLAVVFCSQCGEDPLACTENLVAHCEANGTTELSTKCAAVVNDDLSCNLFPWYCLYPEK